jgi:hypothetical protein
VTDAVVKQPDDSEKENLYFTEQEVRKIAWMYYCHPVIGKLARTALRWKERDE